MATELAYRTSEFQNFARATHQSDMGTVDEYGLIILGNSGVGKSFLANVLLNRESFVHEFSCSSVTHNTEFEEINIGYYPLAIFNIPGLIEAEQERIDLNKQEIDKAFSLRPNSVVMFVFGQTGGRVKEEDIVAFNAINAAYPFKNGSLVLVVNGLPKKRPSNYEGTTLLLLQKLLPGTNVNDRNLCFLDFIDDDNPSAKQHLKERLLKVVVNCIPAKHVKKQEIETLVDQLKQGKQLIIEQREKFDAEKEQYTNQIKEYQQGINEMNAKHQNEIDSLNIAMKRQEEMYAEQKRRFEEDSQRYQTELQEVRSQAQQAQNNYERMSKDTAATLAEIQSARQANEKLQAELIKIASRPPPEPKIIYQDRDQGGLCVIS